MMKKLIVLLFFYTFSLESMAAALPDSSRFVHEQYLNSSSAKSPSKFRTDTIKQSIPTIFNQSVQSNIDAIGKRKEQVGKMLGLSNYYFPVYEKVLKEYGLPEELKFLSVIESALNPHAVSRVGATGPWQFMAPTAKSYGLKINQEIDERKDPVQASKAAAAYLKDAFNQFGDWLLAIASYNCGMGAVSRAIIKAGGKADFWEISRYLPAETRNYVPKFLATAYIMSNYREFGINPLAPAFNTMTDVVDVIKPVSLTAVAKATGIDLQQLILLNPAYKKLIINGSKDAPKPLVIPTNNNPDYFALYQVLNGGPVNQNKIEPKTQAAATNTLYHTVKKGENLSTIAKKFPGVTVNQLKVWNGLKSSSLSVGMRLKIRKP
jgi:membrane-bound lytic murein transglycosylase D